MELFADKYEILAELAGGAQAQVFRARHIELDRLVIVKKLTSDCLTSEASLRFKNEARISAQLNHQSIAMIYDYGAYDVGYFIASEYVAGKDLRTILQQKILLNQEQKKQIIIDLVTALAYAHQKGIVHQDIKPGNIMITPDFRAKIIDFGLARLKNEASAIQVGSVAGTPMYFAPESIQGELVTPAVDWFACGATIWELITGERMFTGASINEIFYQIIHSQPDFQHPAFADWPDEFIRQLQQMVAKNPRDRVVDPNAICTVLALPRLQPIAASKWLKNPRWLKYGAFLIFGFISVLAFLLIMLYTSSPHRRVADIHHSQVLSTELAPGSSTDTAAISIHTSTLPVRQPAVIEKKISAFAQPETLSTMSAQPDTKSVMPPLSSVIQTESGRGFLTIICHPWAEVYLDDIKIGVTPLPERIDLGSGHHDIIFKNPEFPVIKKDLHIPVGQMYLLKINLYHEVGYLDLKVYPFAQVFVDDRFIGFSPLSEKVKLSAGDHTLRLVNDQYPEAKKEFQVSAAETLTIAVNLTRLNPWHEN